MNVLITGGSGFIGHELVRQLYDKCKRIVVYSRDEAKQAAMKQKWPEYPDNRMRYMIGDIRDLDRLRYALNGIDHVIHAAAMKRVEVCCYDPFEAIKTNVEGSMNVVAACIKERVQRAVLISTDKAVEPITTYGKSKALAEDVFIQGNVYGHCCFSVVRYANVEESTGSLLKIWRDQLMQNKPLTVTHRNMTRMWITGETAASFVIDCLSHAQPGEIWVPDCEGKRIVDIAQELAPGYPMREIGLRPAEKMHEILLSESDARDCWKRRGKYVAYPEYHPWIDKYEYSGEKMPDTFRCSSNKGEE